MTTLLKQDHLSINKQFKVFFFFLSERNYLELIAFLKFSYSISSKLIFLETKVKVKLVEYLNRLYGITENDVCP